MRSAPRRAASPKNSKPLRASVRTGSRSASSGETSARHRPCSPSRRWRGRAHSRPRSAATAAAHSRPCRPPWTLSDRSPHPRAGSIRRAAPPGLRGRRRWTRRHLDAPLHKQILAVDEQVAAAGQRRGVDLILEGRDLLPAKIKIGEVVILGVVVKERRHPVRLREQRDIGLVDAIDVTFAHGRSVSAWLGAAVVLIEIVNVEGRGQRDP